MNDNEPASLKYVGNDELGKVLGELSASAQRGDLLSLAVRVYRPDGTYEDIVAGYKSEDERLAMLADLERRIRTETN